MKSNWMLFPHVDPAPEERRSMFRRTVEKVLGLRPWQCLTSAILTEALRDKRKRNSLRECYNEIIAQGARRYHNRISMSLYSGPKDQHPRETWDYFWLQHCQLFGWFDRGLPGMPHIIPEGRFNVKTVGWIGTGDADLRVNKVREKWQDTFEPLKDNVSTLLLPHHGSKWNFHQDLLQFPNLDLCIASSSHPSQYDHPSGEVVGKIQGSEKVFRHVTQNTNSALIEKMRLV